MRVITIRAMTFLLVISLGGCAGSFSGSPNTTIEATAVSACPVTATGAAPTRAAYDRENTDARRGVARNAFIDSCVAAIDTSYGAFAQGLSNDQKTFAIGSDVATSGLAAAATLAKSARTKTHLTTYASLVLGLRGSVDKELFLSKTLPALITQMNASRAVVMARIIQGKARTDAEYSLDAALSDLKAYYAAGTLNGALTEITNDAGVKNRAATEEISKINRYKSTADDTSDKINTYLAVGTDGFVARLDLVASCSPSAQKMSSQNDKRREVAHVLEAGTREECIEIIGCLKGNNQPIN
jgi:hypothetical protein